VPPGQDCHTTQGGSEKEVRSIGPSRTDSEKTLLQCQFVHHEADIKALEIKRKAPQREVEEVPLELWYDQILLSSADSSVNLMPIKASVTFGSQRECAILRISRNDEN
jgi:hypothetical protein